MPGARDRESARSLTILLFTRDCTLGEVVAGAVAGASANILITRTAAAAIQIVCEPRRELDVAVAGALAALSDSHHQLLAA